MKCSLKYEYWTEFNTKNHKWTATCGAGGVFVFIRESINGAFETYGGVEYHHRNPPKCRERDTPDHTRCVTTGGPCWHEGSSAASHEWIDRWRANPHDHDVMLKTLQEEMIEHFYGEDE
jgi:hypothetical protein